MSPSENAIERRLQRAWVQKFVGWVAYCPLGALIMTSVRTILGCRIENLEEIRELYARLAKDTRTPLLVCSNHLTYIDSVLLMYAFGSPAYYARDFRRLSWNLPAAEYQKQPLFRFIGLIGKCLFIDRSGTKEAKDELLEVSRRLLEAGEIMTIFPEGRRSRLGYLDERKPAFGIAKIIAKLPECRVLCLYMRARGQDAFSKYPRYGSRFRILSELVTYRGGETKVSPTLDILARLRRLEDRYFETTGETAPVREIVTPVVAGELA